MAERDSEKKKYLLSIASHTFHFSLSIFPPPLGWRRVLQSLPLRGTPQSLFQSALVMGLSVFKSAGGKGLQLITCLFAVGPMHGPSVEAPTGGEPKISNRLAQIHSAAACGPSRLVCDGCIGEPSSPPPQGAKIVPLWPIYGTFSVRRHAHSSELPDVVL